MVFTLDIDTIIKCAELLLDASKEDVHKYQDLIATIYNDKLKVDKPTFEFVQKTLAAVKEYMTVKYKMLNKAEVYSINTSQTILPINSHQRMQKYSTFSGNHIIGIPIIISQVDKMAYISTEEALEWHMVNGFSPCNDGSLSIFNIGISKYLKS